MVCGTESVGVLFSSPTCSDLKAARRTEDAHGSGEVFAFVPNLPWSGDLALLVLMLRALGHMVLGLSRWSLGGEA